MEDGDLLDPSEEEKASNENIVNSETFVQSLLDNIERVRVSKATKRGLKRMSNSGSNFRDNTIILDTACPKTMFNDRELFSSINESTPIIVEGINSSAQPLIITKEGTSILGRAYYDPMCAGNILSFGEAVDSFDRVSYDSRSDEFNTRGC